MNMIFLLIGFSILLAVLFLFAFFWASKSGQHDDLYTPAVRILFDDRPDPFSNSAEQSGVLPGQPNQLNPEKAEKPKSDEDHQQA